MKVGVTGATGFIGRHTVRALSVRGHEVLAFVRDPTACSADSARRVDLADAAGLVGTFDGLDAVVHLAAHVPRVHDDLSEARRCLDVNALGTLALLQEAARAKVGLFVLASGNLYRLTRDLVDEQAPIHPSAHASSYMVSKAAADFYAQHYAENGLLHVAILRIGNVYGAELGRGLIAVVRRKLLGRESVQVEAGERYTADLVHVYDVAAACVAAVERRVRGVFNVGTGVATTPQQVAETLAKSLGASRDLIDLRPPPPDARLAGFSPLDSRLAARVLGFAPRSLEQGLHDDAQALKAGLL